MMEQRWYVIQDMNVSTEDVILLLNAPITSARKENVFMENVLDNQKNLYCN